MWPEALYIKINLTLNSKRVKMPGLKDAFDYQEDNDNWNMM